MRRMIVLGLNAAVLAVSCLVTSTLAARADDWPSRPVRIVVPFAAGGAADTFGRLYADALSQTFGKQFYVENRTGAGGVIAQQEVARAQPDGYTLGVSGMPTQVIAPAMNKNAGFDPMRDFTHIAYFGGAPNALVVHPSLGAQSFAEFLARAKSESGGLQYVSAGLGTVGNLVGEFLAAKAGIKLVHVAYKGGANAVLDLVAGNVKVGLLTYSSVSGQINAGKILPLAISSAARLPQMPNVPTLVELGYPEMVATTWFALSGPAGLPADIVAKINHACVEAMSRPQIRDLAAKQAVEEKPMSPAEVTRFFQSEIDKWQPVIARMVGAKQ